MTKREQNILKAVLLLRKVNAGGYSTKEEQIEDVKTHFEKGYITDESLQKWIDGLKEELAKSPEQRKKESEEYIEWLCELEAEQSRQEMESDIVEKSYGPSNPWDAPGMSVSDFI